MNEFLSARIDYILFICSLGATLGAWFYYCISYPGMCRGSWRIVGWTVAVTAAMLVVVRMATGAVGRYGYFDIVLQACFLILIYKILLHKMKEYGIQVTTSERRYRSLVEGSPNNVSLFDSEGRYLTINRGGLSAMSWTESEVIGKPFRDTWPEDIQPVICEAVEQVLRGEQVCFEAQNIRADGIRVTWYVVLNPIIGGDGKVDHFLSIMTNVSDRRQAEEESRSLSRFLESIIDNADIWLDVTDTDGNVLIWNKAAEQISGYPRDEVVGHNRVWEWLYPGLDCRPMGRVNGIPTDSELGLADDLETTIHRKDGETRIVSWQSQVLANEKGDHIGSISLARDVTEQKHAEKALRESENRYRGLIESQQDLIVRTTPDGVFTFVNDAYCSTFGRSREDLLGASFVPFIHHEDVSSTVSAMETLNFPPYRATMVQRAMTVNGWRWFAWEDCAILDDTGKIVEIQGVGRDITEHKRVETDLQQMLQQQKAILTNIPDIAWLKDRDGRFIAVNEQFGRACGINPEELVGKTDLDIWPKELAERYQSDDREVVTSGKRKCVEEPLADKEGMIQWIETIKTPIFNKLGEVVGATGIARDITARKKVEANLRLQISAINAAGDQIVITDVDGTILFVNPAFEKETGFTAEEVIGKKSIITKSGKHDESFYENMWNTILSANIWHGEVFNCRKDGSIYIEDVTITPVMNDNGEIENFVAIKRNITERKIYEQKLDRLAHRDHLTGLPNRLLFSDRLTQNLAKARSQGESLAVMFIDLDQFKLINDTLGHSLGDALLKQVSERLTLTLRGVDTLARMGGDEFTLILSDIRTSADTARVAQRIRESFSKAFVLRGHELFITASMGISMYPDHGQDAETLVRNADTAMYRAKEQGRNTYHLYTDDLNMAVLQRITLENDLRGALKHNEIQVYYQPKVDLRTGAIIGTEALARWNHPRHGFIPPDQFIPLAEETGLIVSLTEQVLQMACSQNKAWQDTGMPPTTIAVNISARQFQQGDLVDMVKRVLQQTGLAPEYLDLELTEGSLVENPEATVRCLMQIKAMGVRISIDDFGTGYSSLSYLKQFPVNTVKIDRSFVKDIVSNPDDAAIAGAVVAMAHSLKLKVIAEGVETLEQLQFLQSLDCDEMQGYFVSRPVPSDDMFDLLCQSQPTTSDDLHEAA